MNPRSRLRCETLATSPLSDPHTCAWGSELTCSAPDDSAATLVRLARRRALHRLMDLMDCRDGDPEDLRPCDACGGTGIDWHQPDAHCLQCRGEGWRP